MEDRDEGIGKEEAIRLGNKLRRLRQDYASIKQYATRVVDVAKQELENFEGYALGRLRMYATGNLEKGKKSVKLIESACTLQFRSLPDSLEFMGSDEALESQAILGGFIKADVAAYKKHVATMVKETGEIKEGWKYIPSVDRGEGFYVQTPKIEDGDGE